MPAVVAAVLGAATIAAAEEAKTPGSGFRHPDGEALPDLFQWTDTCNVYVLRDGDDALLIDLGDGGVIDRLGEIGVASVEWILFTHHHREQCQGDGRWAGGLDVQA